MNPMDKLRGLTDKMKPSSMVMGLLESYLPQIKSFADKLNRPADEGGILESGEGMATLMIDFSMDQPQIYVATLSDRDGATMLSRTIDMKDLMAKMQEDGSGE